MDQNTTSVDPRERLVKVGNDLLTAIYDNERFERDNAEVIQATRENRMEDAGKMLEAMAPERRVEFFIGVIGLSGRVKELRHEYVTLRETIEALAPMRDKGAGA